MQNIRLILFNFATYITFPRTSHLKQTESKLCHVQCLSKSVLIHCTFPARAVSNVSSRRAKTLQLNQVTRKNPTTTYLYSQTASLPICRVLTTISDTCLRADWGSTHLFLRPCSRTASNDKHKPATQLSNSVASSVLPP